MKKMYITIRPTRMWNYEDLVIFYRIVDKYELAIISDERRMAAEDLEHPIGEYFFKVTNPLMSAIAEMHMVNLIGNVEWIASDRAPESFRKWLYKKNKKHPFGAIRDINTPLNEGGDPNDDHDENQQP